MDRTKATRWDPPALNWKDKPNHSLPWGEEDASPLGVFMQAVVKGALFPSQATGDLCILTRAPTRHRHSSTPYLTQT